MFDRNHSDSNRQYQLSELPSHEESVALEMADARLSALQLNEERLQLEREAIVIMRLCIQAELTRVSRYCGTR